MLWKFSYAGVELPPPDQDGFVPEWQPIDDAERNANAGMDITHIAMKYKIPVTWSNRKGDKINLIFKTLEANRTGTLVFYNISKGAMDTMQVYWGAGAKASFKKYDDDLKSQIWSSASVSFIEM